MNRLEDIKISLVDIKSATSNFSPESLLGRGAFGNVYKGQLRLKKDGLLHTVAIKRRLDGRSKQGRDEFGNEIFLLTKYTYKNLVSLLGFCDEGSEMILVYEYMTRGSLDKYLKDSSFTWLLRLRACVGAARGLAYLHNPPNQQDQQRVVHRDIKSANILLDEDWEAKIGDFGLSREGRMGKETFIMSNPCGTPCYIDPVYFETRILTKESDVYSFGVVMFELLMGKLASDENFPIGLAQMAKTICTLDIPVGMIVNPDIKDQIRSNALKVFTMVACQCLHKKPKERPSMDSVVQTLEKAQHLQMEQTSNALVQLPKPIVIVSRRFVSSYPVHLTIIKKKSTFSEGSFEVLDVNGNVFLGVKDKISIRDRHMLVDAADYRILTFQPKMITLHQRWSVFRGDSSDTKNLIFSAKESSLRQWKTSLDVFLASNQREEAFDFKVKGSGLGEPCTIHPADGKTIIAQMHEKHIVQKNPLRTFVVDVYPNVDYAFIVALIMILSDISKEHIYIY